MVPSSAGVKKDLKPEPVHQARTQLRPAKLIKAMGATSEAPVRNCEGFPTTSTPRTSPEAGRLRRRRRPDRRHAHRQGRHQRGLRRHPYPQLRPESRAAPATPTCTWPRTRCSTRQPPPGRADSLQRPQPRQVRPHREAGRHHHLRQLHRQGAPAGLDPTSSCGVPSPRSPWTWAGSW